MDTGIAPTRSNLMRIRDELAFSRLGYELLDQKRSILVSELLTLVDQAVDYQNRVEKALGEAQKSLEDSIMHMGRLRLGNLAGAVGITSEIELGRRRVMGVSLPRVHTSYEGEGPFFSPEGTSMLSEVALERYRDALTLMGLQQGLLDPVLVVYGLVDEGQKLTHEDAPLLVQKLVAEPGEGELLLDLHQIAPCRRYARVHHSSLE